MTNETSPDASQRCAPASPEHRVDRSTGRGGELDARSPCGSLIRGANTRNDGMTGKEDEKLKEDVARQDEVYSAAVRSYMDGQRKA